jgi:hypothetical protein
VFAPTTNEWLTEAAASHTLPQVAPGLVAAIQNGFRAGPVGDPIDRAHGGVKEEAVRRVSGVLIGLAWAS